MKHMAEFIRILELNNEVEAAYLAAALEAEGIPFVIVSYHDTALDGLYQFQMGWGHVEASEEHKARILEIHESRTSTQEAQ
jgi:hypothetical protein